MSMKEYKVIGCISTLPEDSVFYEESEAYLFTDYTRQNTGVYASSFDGIKHLVCERFPAASLVLTTGGMTKDGQLWDVAIEIGTL